MNGTEPTGTIELVKGLLAQEVVPRANFLAAQNLLMCQRGMSSSDARSFLRTVYAEMHEFPVLDPETKDQEP